MGNVLRTLDRYLIAEMIRPLTAALVVILCALLLERILRLIDLVAAHGGPLGPVLQMAVNLIPHYLGLALPAAFFIAMFAVVARLSDEAELDAMMALGRSIRRIEIPFVLIAVVLTLISLALYGFLQPYTRYAYRAILNTVQQTAWMGDVPQGVFVDAGDGMTIFAEAVDASGQRMTGLFIHERHANEDVITTAEYGELAFEPAEGKLTLNLGTGRQLRARDESVALLDFDHYAFARDFAPEAFFFRSRGADEREMTLAELYEQLRAPDGTSRHSYRAELHGRLARSLTILFLPLFAIPMGLAAKRRRRGAGLVLAAGTLVIYHHALQFGEGLVDIGRADPLLAIWGPFAAFGVFCIVVTARTDLKAGMGPLDGALNALDSAASGLARLVPLRWRTP